MRLGQSETNQLHLTFNNLTLIHKEKYIIKI